MERSIQMHGEGSEETYAVPSSSKKRKSWVWKHFDQIKKKGKDIAMCKNCKKELVGSSKSGTTHLSNHFSRCPAKKDAKTHKKMTSTPIETAGNGRDFVFDNNRSLLDVARMIIMHEYSLNMVEHEHFQIFLKNVQPNFKLYSKDTVKAAICHVYEKEKKELCKYLGTLSCHFNLIIQFWTCHSKKNLYCCFALQFLEDGLILKNKILALKKIDQYNDIVEGKLFGTVTSLLQEWKIDKNLCSITLESSPSNDVMVRKLGSTIPHQAYPQPFREHFFHIHCITNITNRLLQDGLNEIGGVLCKIRSTIRYINEAPIPWKVDYQSILQEHNLQDKYNTICEDVSTRWNSRFLMLESALELRKVFFKMKNKYHAFKAVTPSVEDWDTAVVIYKCLKVIYYAICSFSESKYLTTNVYFPHICRILLALRDCQKSEQEYIRLMVGRMEDKLNKYFDEYRMVLTIAIILDPRRKLSFVKYVFDRLYGCEAGRSILRDIHKTLNDVFDGYAKELGNDKFGNDYAKEHGMHASSSSDHDNYDLVDEWYQHECDKLRNVPREELHRYLQMNVIDNKDRNFEIWGWWRSNSSYFPILGKMAVDILKIPMSTCVISNYGFNTEAMATINPAFDGLDSEIIEALVCGRHWLDSSTKMTPIKEEEHSSGCSLKGEGIVHDHTSMALATTSLTSLEFDQKKLDSLSAAKTRLVPASCRSIGLLDTTRSPTLQGTVHQEHVSSLPWPSSDANYYNGTVPETHDYTTRSPTLQGTVHQEHGSDFICLSSDANYYNGTVPETHDWPPDLDRFREFGKYDFLGEDTNFNFEI